LPVQERIAGILSAYDDLIENNQKQVKLLEEAAQRLYKEWFVDLNFPGLEHTPIVDGVPEGWEQQSLGKIASVLRRGSSPQYDDSGKYCVISQKCIHQSIMDISEARREAKGYLPELNLQDKDTVICSTGTGTLGPRDRLLPKLMSGEIGVIFEPFKNELSESKRPEAPRMFDPVLHLKRGDSGNDKIN